MQLRHYESSFLRELASQGLSIVLVYQSITLLELDRYQANQNATTRDLS